MKIKVLNKVYQTYDESIKKIVFSVFGQERLIKIPIRLLTDFITALTSSADNFNTLLFKTLLLADDKNFKKLATVVESPALIVMMYREGYIPKNFTEVWDLQPLKVELI